jgi:hypothetical protein
MNFFEIVMKQKIKLHTLFETEFLVDYKIKNAIYAITIKFASINKDPSDKSYFSGGGVVL